ncbi:uncharacterized protein N7518_004269 [Penicillium psychrosexuale]|uniref:uncharacterized protein n=1 Tax=Penicillium psychrosexuale TaxID=1002107 RepID=UPI002544DCFF|nr:uncharacterized protein N7518_004269 [Penicillium psychrosexuale]KAJ5795729.1 hypothetical protein N7518_004269 [Penicillium psychrosexuale]
MQNIDSTCYIGITLISLSLTSNLIVGSFIFPSKGCRGRSHDYHESPKSDFFVYYPRLRFISLVLLFYAWHLCLADFFPSLLSCMMYSIIPTHLSLSSLVTQMTYDWSWDFGTLDTSSV